jgi:phosphatidylserine/phosphatidylglycerophosphate/cardiolipin synthase-like enzyme
MKFLAVDDELAIVGSSNHDVHSWHNAREIAVVVDDDARVASWMTSTSFDRAVVTERCR